jgi:hypothetical protein
MKGTIPLLYSSDHYNSLFNYFDTLLYSLFLAQLSFLTHSLIVIVYLILLYAIFDLLIILYNCNFIVLPILNNTHQEFDFYLFYLVINYLGK